MFGGCSSPLLAKLSRVRAPDGKGKSNTHALGRFHLCLFFSFCTFHSIVIASQQQLQPVRSLYLHRTRISEFHRGLTSDSLVSPIICILADVFSGGFFIVLTSTSMPSSLLSPNPRFAALIYRLTGCNWNGDQVTFWTACCSLCYKLVQTGR